MRATIQQVGIVLTYGSNWHEHKWTYLLRYAGAPITEVNSHRLKKLAKTYPAIYQERKGKCKECIYRPCLKYMQSNAFAPKTELDAELLKKLFLVKLPTMF